MQAKEILRALDLGNSVAEFDESLEKYFVETESFRALVSGNYDVIAGDKGTGKTALYRALLNRRSSLPELSTVEIIPAFNPAGNPVFQRLTQLAPLAEGQYVTIWKSYFLSLVGNFLLELFEDAPSDSMRELDNVLKRVGLRSPEQNASTIFSKLINTFGRLLQPKSAEVGLSLSEAGIPVVTPKLEFASTNESPKEEVIFHEEALGLLNKCLAEIETQAWIVLDRLDEAFQGYQETERPALRALLRTYLDLSEFDSIHLKLFVRRDLFRRIVQGGFVNLTHVNARRLDIVWDEEDLRNLLARRIKGVDRVVELLNLSDKSDTQIFDAIFPAQVDVGSRKPSTWNWMMSRIRDGNRVKPPRNLIDLVKKAQEAQLRAEDRQPREIVAGVSPIEADSIRRAHQRLSEDRVQDTLLAEAADLAPLIEAFRDGKAEHNVGSLAELLRVAPQEVKITVKPLMELGFLEEIGDTYKVPMIYRDGLGITQGKAFSASSASDLEDESD